jgi:pyruvate-ferredoxin/flavodoxin oxidoreductase
MLAMTYGNVYVGRIAMGANDAHTVRVMREAEAYDGPSLILAYSHCIAHGFNLAHGMEQQKLAVQCGHWPLMRYNPDQAADGANPFTLDSKAPSLPLKKYAYNETRYTMLAHSKPQVSNDLLDGAQENIHTRWKIYEKMAEKTPVAPNGPAAGNNNKDVEHA